MVVMGGGGGGDPRSDKTIYLVSGFQYIYIFVCHSLILFFYPAIQDVHKKLYGYEILM